MQNLAIQGQMIRADQWKYQKIWSVGAISLRLRYVDPENTLPNVAYRIEFGCCQSNGASILYVAGLAKT